MIDTLGQIHLMPKSKEHYVNNKEFLAAIIEYKDNVEIAKLKGLKKPAVGEYIGGCFLKICLLYTSPSPRDRQKSRMPSSA